MPVAEHELHVLMDARALANGARDAEAELVVLRDQERVLRHAVDDANVERHRTASAVAAVNGECEAARSAYHAADDDRRAANQAVDVADAEAAGRRASAADSWRAARVRFSMIVDRMKSIGDDLGGVDAESLRQVEREITIELGADLAATWRALELARAVERRARDEARVRDRVCDEHSAALFGAVDRRESALRAARAADDALQAAEKKLASVVGRIAELERRVREARS